MKMFNIALLSPSKDAYSETFIQAHKDLLIGNKFYYYSGELPERLEGGIVINSRRSRIIDIIKGHFKLSKFSLPEQALITSFKHNKIKIVFAEYGGTGQKVLPICRELKIPLIVHFHGSDASQINILETNQYYKELFKYVSYVIVVSTKMYQDLLKWGCPKQKLVYNIYGPREEFLKVAPQFSKRQFIAVGRFVDKKAPYYLILSFLEVVKRFPDAKLLMAGKGPLLNTCKNLVDYLGLQNNISFLGVISAESFRGYLAESLALVQHSITAKDGDAEGTPLSILEASAAGLPVISTYHAGIPEIIVNDESGLLVEEHDVKGMAENICKIITDRALGKRLGKKGKTNIGENFSLKRHIDVLNKLIEKAID